MNQNKLFLSIFLAVVTGSLTVFASIEIYDRYKAQQIINVLNESAEKFMAEIDATNERHKQKRAQKEAEQQAKVRAIKRAKEQARLYALAEQNRKIEQSRLLMKREMDFDKWYQENRSDECKEEAYGEMNIECINEKIKAEREFKSKY